MRQHTNSPEPQKLAGGTGTTPTMIAVGYLPAALLNSFFAAKLAPPLTRPTDEQQQRRTVQACTQKTYCQTTVMLSAAHSRGTQQGHPHTTHATIALCMKTVACAHHPDAWQQRTRQSLLQANSASSGKTYHTTWCNAVEQCLMHQGSLHPGTNNHYADSAHSRAPLTGGTSTSSVRPQQEGPQTNLPP